MLKEKSREYSNFRNKMADELAACKENAAREIKELTTRRQQLEEQLNTAKTDNHKLEQDIQECRQVPFHSIVGSLAAMIL